MGPYGDTNFVTALYLATGFETEAQECLAAGQLEKLEPMCLTDLTCIEVANAMQFHVFHSRNGGPLRVTAEMAGASFALFEEDLEHTDVYDRHRLGWPEVRAAAQQLSLRHTAKHGFRTHDVVHVASALLFATPSGVSTNRPANSHSSKASR